MPHVILTAANPDSKARTLMGLRGAWRAIGDFDGDDSLTRAEDAYNRTSLGPLNLGYTPWEGLAERAATCLREAGCTVRLDPDEADTPGEPEVDAPTPEQQFAQDAGEIEPTIEGAKYALIALVTAEGNPSHALTILRTYERAGDPSGVFAGAVALLLDTFPRPEIRGQLDV